jgi:hypothetical protein
VPTRVHLGARPVEGWARKCGQATGGARACRFRLIRTHGQSQWGRLERVLDVDGGAPIEALDTAAVPAPVIPLHLDELPWLQRRNFHHVLPCRGDGTPLSGPGPRVLLRGPHGALCSRCEVSTRVPNGAFQAGGLHHIL